MNCQSIVSLSSHWLSIIPVLCENVFLHLELVSVINTTASFRTCCTEQIKLSYMFSNPAATKPNQSIINGNFASTRMIKVNVKLQINISWKAYLCTWPRSRTKLIRQFITPLTPRGLNLRQSSEKCRNITNNYKLGPEQNGEFLQTKNWNAFCWMKKSIFWFTFH